MARVRIENMLDAWAGPDTPIIAGILDLGGRQQNVPFLVDTGACFTSLNGLAVPYTKDVWGLGKTWESHGVGAMPWPAKLFENAAALTLRLEDGSDMRFPIPHLILNAPYITKDHRAAMSHVTPGRNGPVTNKMSQAPNLLGRTFFAANKLALRWDPQGDSYIDALQVPVVTTVPTPKDQVN